MRVLIVYPKFYIYGGAETLIVQLCNYLSNHGFENGILTTEMLPEVERDLVKTRIMVYKFRKKNSVISDVVALTSGLKSIEKEYDVINVHNFPADISGFFTRKPVVWMCNEPEAALVLNDQRFKNYPWRLKIFYKTSFWAESRLSKFLIKNAVVADDFNRKRFVELFGFKPQVINYGIEFDFFSKPVINNSLKQKFDGKFIVLQSGTITPLKNQMGSLRAINKVKKSIPNILLILTGPDIDPDYKATILEYIQENNLDSHVFFRGHVNKQELREFYYICDVLLHPIKAQGGWLTPFEVLSAGRPIIVSTETPPADIIRNNQLGIVSDNFAEALLDCFNNPEKLEQMALKGKKFVSDNLLWNHYCEKMLRFFEETSHLAAKG